MAHTFTKNHLHAVFSTKERQKLITEDFQPRLWKYVIGISQNIEGHHRKMTFEEEYLALLKKRRIDFDPRFVFD